MAIFPGRPVAVALRKKLLASTPVITPVTPGGWFFPLGSHGYGVGPMNFFFSGQSECQLYVDTWDAPGKFNSVWRMMDGFRALTGIAQPDSKEYFSVTNPASIHSGSNLYYITPPSDGSPRWMEPSTTPGDTSTWGNTDLMDQFLTYCGSKQNQVAQDRPNGLVMIWSEFPSRLPSGDIVYYEAALLEYIKRWRATQGTRSVRLTPVFFICPPYDSGTNYNALQTIRNAWRKIASNAANNVTILVGSTADTVTREPENPSHWTWESSYQISDRASVPLAHWAFDNGLVSSSRDLSYLPRLGPTPVTLERVSGQANKLRVGMFFDDTVSDDMTPPSGTPSYGLWDVKDNGTQVGVTNITRISGKTSENPLAVLELTMASNISGNGIITLEISPRTPFEGFGSQWTSNWHLKTKPAAYTAIDQLKDVKFPVNRYGGVVTLGTSNAPTGGTSGGGGGGGGASVTVPPVVTPPALDWTPEGLTGLVLAVNTNDTTKVPDDGQGRVASFTNLYSTRKLSSPDANTRPTVAGAAGASGNKRVLNLGTGRYLQATSTDFPELAAAFSGAIATKNFTVSLAVKLPASFDTSELFNAADAGSVSYYDLYRRSGPESLEARVRENGVNSRGLAAGTYAGWHVVTMVKSGTDVILRVDGQEKARGTYGGSASITIANFMINARSVDDVIDTALSADLEAISGLVVTSNVASSNDLTGIEWWLAQTAGITGLAAPTVAVVDPATQTFSISPDDPGTRDAGPQTLVITSQNITDMSWTRFGPAPNYAWVGGELDDGKWTDVPTTGSLSINPNWTEDGQRVKVWPKGNLQGYKDTLPVKLNAVASVPAAPGTARAKAHAFVKDLVLGANVERMNTDFVTQAWINDIKAAGMSHLRFFMYSNSKLGFLTKAQRQGHYDAIKLCLQNGIKVLFELQDISGIAEMNNAGTLPYLRECCDDINAQGWDKSMFAVGHANELEGAGNDVFNQVNNAALDAMRARLHADTILTHSSGNWGHPDELTNSNMQMGSDKQRVYCWHYYEWDYLNKDAYAARKNQVNTWADAKGVEFCNAEFGKYDSAFNDKSYTTYPGVIDAYAKGAGGGGTLWTFTKGSGWRINVGTTGSAADNLMRSEIKTAFTTANAWIRAQEGFGA